jgi:hypothetical protein
MLTFKLAEERLYPPTFWLKAIFTTPSVKPHGCQLRRSFVKATRYCRRGLFPRHLPLTLPRLQIIVNNFAFDPSDNNKLLKKLTVGLPCIKPTTNFTLLS